MADSSDLLRPVNTKSPPKFTRAEGTIVATALWNAPPLDSNIISYKS